MNSYFKFLSRNRLYAVIEAFGLSISLGFVLVLLCYAHTEFRVGKVRPESDKVYVVGTGNMFGMTKGTAEAFFHSVPEISSWTRYDWQSGINLMCDGEYFKVDAASADSNFFKIFSFALDGSARNEVLASKNEVLLSRSFAKRVFGSENPAGRVIEYSGESYTVVGTVEDFGPEDVFKPCDVWFNFDVLTAQYPEMDSFGSCQTFVTLLEGASPEEVASVLLDKYTDYWSFYKKDETDGGFLFGSTLTRLDKIYYIEGIDADVGPFRTGNRSIVEVLAILAIVLLVSAVFNYVNLTVALVTKRAPEMAMRRLLGESSAGIRMRYLSESVVFTFLSGIVGALLAWAVKPFFESVLDTEIVFCFSLSSIALAIGVLLVVSTLCALIPSSIANGFQPMDVVKGEFRFRSKNVFSKVFIVFQCAFSTLLLAISLTMFFQLRYLDRLPKGYESDEMIQMYTYQIARNMSELQALADRLAALPQVDVVAAASATPVNCGFNGVHEEGVEGISWIRNVMVDTVAFRLLGFKVKEQYCDPVPGMWYVDEDAAQRYNVSETQQYFGGTAYSKEYKCCGIVENFRCGNAIDKPEDDSHSGIEIIGGDSYVHGLLIKTNGDRKTAYESVMKACRDYCGESFGIQMDLPAKYLDDELDDALKGTWNMFRLVTVFMVIAILISSLGILAMSIYYTGQQCRHIALRKVFGADTFLAAWTLSKRFILLSSVASLLSVPLCDLALRRYLQGFVNAVPYPWHAIVIAVAATVLMTIITIAANTISAALRSPVVSLRKE